MKIPRLFPLLASALLLAGCQTPNKPTTATTTPAPVPLTANLAGDWSWVCCDGHYHGALKLQQAANKITGRLFDENDTTGGVIEGTVNGNTVQLIRTWGDDFRQDYALTLSADSSKLAGEIDGTRDESFGSHFEATRK